MDGNTYIKLYRNIVEWGWFKDGNTLKVFIWLLVNANIKSGEFFGAKIGRGQIATSYETVAKQTGLTYSQARTAIRHLKMTGEITGRSYRDFQVLTIVKYSQYQDGVTGNLTGRSQAGRRPVTGKPQQSKKERKEERKNSAPAVPYDDRSWEASIPIAFRGRFKSKEDYDRWNKGVDE